MKKYIVAQNEIFQNVDGELVWIAAFQSNEDAIAVAEYLNSCTKEEMTLVEV